MSEVQAEMAALTIAQFCKALHDRSAFSCGFAPMEKFLKEALTQHIETGYLTAFMITEEHKKDVLGFYTLNAFAVRSDHIETPDRPRPPPTIPATYIKAVGVHTDWQNNRLGETLMVHAMQKTLHHSKSVGTMAIVLDVLKDEQFERRWKFYENLGFRPMNDPDNKNRVFISMRDVSATLGPKP
jgi:ribosomal protein S18 acetylase RimI-like enzyme